jgi:hypothetical protein
MGTLLLLTRCRVAVELGLDPTRLCPNGGLLLVAPWRQQKRLMARSVELVAALAWELGGLHAVMRLTETVQLANCVPCALWQRTAAYGLSLRSSRNLIHAGRDNG